MQVVGRHIFQDVRTIFVTCLGTSDDDRGRASLGDVTCSSYSYGQYNPPVPILAL